MPVSTHLHPARRAIAAPPLRRRRRAFTLIEILIVVTLLGILAAIAVPTVFRYISQADDALARSNIQAVKRAVIVYYQRNGFYPPAITPDLFMNNKPPVMPDGYAIVYDPVTGVVDLMTP